MIWGHVEVYVEKHVEKREWRVYTPKVPRQLLVTIPWADAFRGITHQQAPDYAEAISTCMSSRVTALTEEEELSVMNELNGVPAKNPPAPGPDAPPTNVLPFRKKR